VPKKPSPAKSTTAKSTPAKPAKKPAELAKTGRSELVLRVVSSAVLAPLAIGLAYVGGWPFWAFWAIAAAAILWEWRKIVADPGPVLKGLGECMIAIAAASAVTGRTDVMALFVGLGIVVEVIMATTLHFRIWAAAGVLYAAALALSCVLLRNDVDFGFIAIVFLCAIVWATDIMAYFVGRFVGGPKLWMRVSPKKTWSGAAGGAIGAVAAAIAVARYANLANWVALGGLALVLSVVSQAGDLFESAFKRRFGVKDSSHIIPGHGGFMDRLDGFVAAAAVALMIGIARGGLGAPARGLLAW
jgi:phosphatidate cytidylyltransferase